MDSVVFSNEDFIVFDKPAGWLSVPSIRGVNDPRPVLGLFLEKSLGCRVYPVHRVDVLVSGLVLFARNSDAQAAAHQWWESGQVKKTYWARTTWPIDYEPAETVFEDRLVMGKRRSFRAIYGKQSVTHAKIHARDESARTVDWTLEPASGRRHQLRVQLALRGYPIVGDELYGSKLAWEESNGIALRATTLDFSKIPVTERRGLPERISVPQNEKSILTAGFPSRPPSEKNSPVSTGAVP